MFAVWETRERRMGEIDLPVSRSTSDLSGARLGAVVIDRVAEMAALPDGHPPCMGSATANVSGTMARTLWPRLMSGVLALVTGVPVIRKAIPGALG